MSEEAEQSYAKPPFVLTFAGQVMVHFLDGQILEGEITAQDDLNLFLMVDQSPVLIPRAQIRYVKGQVGQSIGPAPLPSVEPILTPLSTAPAPTPLEEPLPPPSDTQPMPAPAPIPALFPEPEPAEPAFTAIPEPAEPLLEAEEDDMGGTLIIPPMAAPVSPDVAATEFHQPVTSSVADTDVTFVLKSETTVPPLTQTQEPGPAEEPEATAVLPSLDLEAMGLALESTEEEDVTFVLKSLAPDEPIAYLVCTTGPHAGEVFNLKRGVVTIGRASDNMVPLSRDKEISRRHAIVAYEASKFVVTDQNSLNGTYVNDQLVKEPHPLEDGDIILVGVSTLKYQEK
jgi:hypothetical protein